MTSPFNQPNAETQTGAQYKNNLDNAAAVFRRTAGAFHIQAQDTPDMTLRCIGGAIWTGATLLEIAASNTAALVAPENHPRVDRLVLNPTDGTIEVIEGVENASPVAPSITGGRLPLARVLLQPEQAEIVNADITDERVVAAGGPRLEVSADRAPNEDDDETQGFNTLSRWFYDGNIYECWSADEGEAVWVSTFFTPDGSIGFDKLADGVVADGGTGGLLREDGDGSGLSGVKSALFAFVNWDATVNDNVSCTYTVNTTGLFTISGTGIGNRVRAGNAIYGVGSSGPFGSSVMRVESVVDANQITAQIGTSGNTAGSGNMTCRFWTILDAVGVLSVCENGSTGYAFINLAEEQPDTNYMCIATPTNTVASVALASPLTVNTNMNAGGQISGKGTSRQLVVSGQFNGTNTNFSQNCATFFRSPL